MVRKITDKVPNAILAADLERYRQEAIRLGATDAKIITVDEVIVDERARLKCRIPMCNLYGVNANCPPYSPTSAETREIVKKYRYAIFCTIETPPEGVVGTDAALANSFRRKMGGIISEIEAMAYYDGYYFAMGFSGGACKQAYCNKLECSALKPGQACRVPLKARPAMEAVGIDAFLMAAKVGWDIYPAGGRLKVEDIPCGRRLGLVLIY